MNTSFEVLRVKIRAGALAVGDTWETLNMQDLKMRDQMSGMENAGTPKNAAYLLS